MFFPERHQKVFLGDKFSDIVDELSESIHVPENSNFETLRIVFNTLARIFWKRVENSSISDHQKDYIRKASLFQKFVNNYLGVTSDEACVRCDDSNLTHSGRWSPFNNVCSYFRDIRL